ncbi:hypothetical protein Aph02nite_57970 [Actinoplanes philippinensis]|uniref:Ig-like domain-containing protein n=2 Tax=Actinoplanes philippinensis TaxID=35752 RepID=A0A1I2JBF3_9ACTN|nr:hypothetical protein Aph02nite_57970 [Actinoplanes philippinensis]SFF51659.1 hypothetical protein SAMN05421541_1123 [Actinoplanes philippinensis]
MAAIVAVPSLLLTRTADAATAAPAKMPVDAASCATLGLTGFDTPSAGTLEEGSCRKFTVTAPQAYLARAADAENRTLASAVYNSGGNLACAVIWCNLGSGTYYLVADPGEPEPHTAPFRATVVDLFGAGCESTAAQGFSSIHQGTFSGQGQVHCQTLPVTSGSYQVTLPPTANQPLVQLVQPTDARLCGNSPVTGEHGCEIVIPQETRVIVVSQDPRDSGDYRFALQRTADATQCADLAPGVPGAPGSMTTSLSDTDFVTCFDVPRGASGSQEILTLDRIAGDGTASLSVYNGSGKLTCRDSAAAAYQQIGCTLGASGHMVVVRSAGGSATYRVSQVTGITANCAAPASLAFGGAATPGSIAGSGDLRCYRAPINSWVDVAAGGATPVVRWFDDQGGLHRCATLPCLVRSGEILVTGAEPTEYALDTWAVGYQYETPADCGQITDSTAYGFGPLTGTFTAEDRAHCVSVQVGYDDDFTVTTQNAVPWVINDDGSVVRCAQSGAAWTCSPTPQRVESRRTLFAFVAEAPGPYRVQADCAKPLCNEGQYWIADSPTTDARYHVVTGSTATLTIAGAGLHQQDTVWLGKNGTKLVPIVIKSVNANRNLYTADIDFTTITPGEYDIAGTSFGAPGRTSTASGQVVVLAPQLAVTAKPAIVGKAVTGAKLTVNAGTWSPAVDWYGYQWYANGTAVPGAIGGSYTVPASMVGKRLTVTLTGNRAGHRSNTATSAAVTVGYGAAPKATTRPKITGTVKALKTVRASVGVWSPKATSYRYEWRVNGKLVAATASLKLAKSWAGKKLVLTVVAKRTGHSDGRAASVTVKIKK